jgi:hypothetical protein
LRPLPDQAAWWDGARAVSDIRVMERRRTSASIAAAGGFHCSMAEQRPPRLVGQVVRWNYSYGPQGTGGGMPADRRLREGGAIGAARYEG